MDREPRPAPYSVGTRLRYIGTRQYGVSEWNGRRYTPPVVILAPGIEVTIDEVRAGYQGTLRQLRDSDGPMYDYDGEPILDTTKDGYSAYSVRTPSGEKLSGRCIDHENADQWVLVQ